MKYFYLACFLVFSGFMVFLSLIFASNFLRLLTVVLLITSLGFFLKTTVDFFPKKIRKHVINFHVILLEPVGLFLVYFLSFLSFFKKFYNLNVNKTPILFVHGYFNFASVWLFQLIRLKKKGYGPLFFVNLGFPFLSIEAYATKIKRKISEIQKITKKKEIVLIGHSMGGIVSSYYAGKYKNHANVKAIITLGSPLKGTKIAKIGIGKCCRQMEIDSSFIKKAQANYPKELLYHIVTKKDQITVPYMSGIINQSKKRAYFIDDLGHNSLLYSIRVTDKIDHWLKKII